MKETQAEESQTKKTKLVRDHSLSYLPIQCPLYVNVNTPIVFVWSCEEQLYVFLFVCLEGAC